MKCSAMVLVAGFLAGLAAGCVTAPGPAFEPPPPRVEVVPAAPGAGHVWIAGHWAWRGGQYVWLPGRHVIARAGRVWVPGHWEKRGRAWVWREGRWRR